eukprot:CAMPEP_0170482552 /NCGR_PEP_ID=MMETSP0208-20121228/2521_1 /TAXON_ID=197538 /ORGANISM="Strombidium inclinatum, Strain S3" /LENGTH=259 /DNA_ID=CAMNT_0010755403 /DNA_START=1 /DNA_END=780 /DNA_ORIENTATION=+
MKINFAALALLVGTSEAVQLKSQAQMMAEIEAMSLNANMNQVEARERTLIKNMLQVDMNEFLQQEMESDVFEGIGEQEKSKLVGDFFKWVRNRWHPAQQNLLQLKNKSKAKTKSPTAAESKAKEDDKNVADWGSGKGNHTPAYNAKDAPALAQKKASSPTAAESKAKEDDKNVADWGSGKGNHTPAFHDAQYVQLEESRKAKMVTPTAKQVQADLDKEKAQELVKPTQKADNNGDAEPTNVQLKAEHKEEPKETKQEKK